MVPYDAKFITIADLAFFRFGAPSDCFPLRCLFGLKASNPLTAGFFVLIRFPILSHSFAGFFTNFDDVGLAMAFLNFLEKFRIALAPTFSLGRSLGIASRFCAPFFDLLIITLFEFIGSSPRKKRFAGFKRHEGIISDPQCSVISFVYPSIV